MKNFCLTASGEKGKPFQAQDRLARKLFQRTPGDTMKDQKTHGKFSIRPVGVSNKGAREL